MSKISPKTVELLAITFSLVAGYLYRAWAELGGLALRSGRARAGDRDSRPS